MSDPHVIHALSNALGSALDAAIAERPGINTIELCGVLGGLAGVVLGQSIPTASAAVDDAHFDAVVGSFRMALRDARERVRAVN